MSHPIDPRAASDRSRTALLLGALLVAVGLAYRPALDGGLLFDDYDWIDGNLAIKDLARFVSRDLWPRVATASGRALTELTFAVNYAQSELQPRAYHLTSLAIHLAAAVLIFLLGRRLLAGTGWPRPDGPALAAAAIWALHPLGSQAVSYVAQRAEALASLLYLASVLLVLVAVGRGRTAGGLAAFVAAVGAAFLGFQAKPIVLSLPAAILATLVLVDRPPSSARGAWRTRLAVVAPFAAASIAFGLATIHEVAGRPDVGFEVAGVSASSYAITQLRVVPQYVRLFLWPAGLSLDHGIEPSRALLAPEVLLSAAVLVALVGGAAALAWWGQRPGRPAPLVRMSRVVAFGIAWFFVLLAPSSTFVPVRDLMVEHRAYLASWGLALAAVAVGATAVETLAGARAPRVGAALALLVCALLGIALHARNRVWAEPTRVWSDVISKSPRNPRGYHNLAQVLATRGDHAGAARLLEQAIALASDPVDRSASLRNLGSALVELGQHARAVGVLLEAEALRPDDAGIQNNLAICYEEQRLFAQAEARARRAVALEPTYPNGYTTLGQVLAERGDLVAALAAFQRASELNPDELPPLYNVAVAQEELGLRAEACRTWLRYGRARGGVSAGEAQQALARLGCGDDGAR